ncbi:MAG: DUF3099 domain-containing protein [Microbacteriaceae bacterium]
MDRETQSLTSLPAAPEDERTARMLWYSFSMALRLICLFLCFVVPGWWIVIPATGVVVLPLIAVALANVVKAPGARKTSSHVPNLSSLPSAER